MAAMKYDLMEDFALKRQYLRAIVLHGSYLEDVYVGDWPKLGGEAPDATLMLTSGIGRITPVGGLIIRDYMVIAS